MALRIIERGVRMVEVYFANGQPWDSHDDILVHAKLARDADGAIASLIAGFEVPWIIRQHNTHRRERVGTHSDDSKERAGESSQRAHHIPPGFATLLAGGGFKGGFAYGTTDDFGFKAEENRVHVHDLHATILHQLGIDHTKLTYRYSGRDFRLTDVAGNVVKGLLA